MYATYDDALAILGSELESWIPQVEGETPAEVFELQLGAAAGFMHPYLAKGGYAVPVDLAAVRAIDTGLADQLVHACAVIACHKASTSNTDSSKALAAEYAEAKAWLEVVAESGGALSLPKPVATSAGGGYFAAADRSLKAPITSSFFDRVRRGLG